MIIFLIASMAWFLSGTLVALGGRKNRWVAITLFIVSAVNLMAALTAGKIP